MIVKWSNVNAPENWCAPITCTVRPSQLAWMRRPELERDGFQVWELPNGELYAHKGPGELKIEIFE